MSLDWNITKVKPSPLVRKEDGTVTGLCEAMILATIPVGISSITDKNYLEFWTRMRMIEIAANVSFATDGDGQRYRLKAEEVKAFIGLWTNASSSSNAAFDRKVAKMLRDQMKDILWLETHQKTENNPQTHKENNHVE